MSKSKKIAEIIENGFAGDVLKAQRPNGRIAKAYKDDTGLFVIQYYNEGMPCDLREEHTNVESLEKDMRQFADLRHWVYDPEAWN